MATKVLKKLHEVEKKVVHKTPNYYKFNLKNYEKAFKGGMGFEL